MRQRLLRGSQLLIDLCVLWVALALAFLIRYDGIPPAPMTGRLLLTGPYVVLFEYLVLVAFGAHRFSWRYVGLREALRISVPCVTATAGLIVARLVFGEVQYEAPYLRHGIVPFGVLAANLPLSFMGILGVRVSRRMLGERLEKLRRSHTNRPTKRTILVGAGQAGVLVAKELASRPDLSLVAVGFADDDPDKLGTVIHGIPVVGLTANLPALCSSLRADQVVITMANVQGRTIRRIREICDDANIAVKIIPGVYEILGGKVNLSRIRDVAIEDLLRREPVQLDLEGLSAIFGGKVVLTTGAGGSIGSELCRQICRFDPAAVILVERTENNLFQIHRELCANFPDLQIVPCIGDVTDRERMLELFAEHRPALVFHAAAHKHVPMMEWNPREAIRNNVIGTQTVAHVAREHGVEAFVMISTDKAVNPTSIMGATKRAAEIYVQALSQRSRTRFVTVRFGNVLGSAGSVIPIFREQIARGGPITVTHPDMQRFFMTIPEACQLVLQAGAMGRGGEIFILDMGEPVKIVDLARDLISLSGLQEGTDIEVQFTGVRPGEKLSEELSTVAEHADRTRHPKIFVGRTEARPWVQVENRVSQLVDSLKTQDDAAAVLALSAVVPEYNAAGTGSGRVAVKAEEQVQWPVVGGRRAVVV